MRGGCGLGDIDGATHADGCIAPPYVPIVVSTRFRLVKLGQAFPFDDLVCQRVERYRLGAVEVYGAFLKQSNGGTTEPKALELSDDEE